MPKNNFTDEQMEILSQSKWVQRVSRSSISFTDEFIQDIAEKLKDRSMRQLLPSYDIDPALLGQKRLINTKYRVLQFLHRPEGLKRKRKERRKFKDDKDRISYLTEINQNLKREYEDLIAKTQNTKLKRADSETFAIIRDALEKSGNRLTLSQLCRWSGSSRSGYYAFIHHKNGNRQNQDDADIEFIKAVYDKGGIEKGAKQIKMQLLRIYGINMNLKKIRRLMKKYGIVCQMRQPSAMKAAMRSFKTTNYKENILQRRFRQGKAKKVLLTDITYLKYANDKTAYLCTIKDATTKQILAWHISESLELDIVIGTVKILIQEYGKELAVDVLLHSDQGCHFTAHDYQSLLKLNGIVQSMSRRGNCWDNAPQESFFSTFKCESGYRKSRDFLELVECTGKYIGYYNLERPQWNLNRMTPNEYDRYLSFPYKKLQLPALYTPEVIYAAHHV